MDALKDFDALKILLWVVPGAMIALFRSFAMRGSFRGITKDDVAAFIIGSLIYAFIGIRLPSLDATAWETVFRELGTGAVLLVTLKDGAKVFGRWVGGRGGSAASTDPKTTDLYLGEIGQVSDAGQYVAIEPRRGIYI